MQKDLIKDIVEKLNENIVCSEYVLKLDENTIKQSINSKEIGEYIKLFEDKNITINKGNCDKLNEAICSCDSENYETENYETEKIELLRYVNIKGNNVYFYSFQGFSDEFFNIYTKMQSNSFLKYILDSCFKENMEIENIDLHISIQLQKYVDFLAKKINEKECSNNLYEEINYISTIKYEGSDVASKMVLIKESLHDKYINFYVELNEPVKFEDHTKVRKLLETSDKTTYLIGDNEKIYGLGKFKNISNLKISDNIFIVDFIGRFEYKINVAYSEWSIVKKDIDNEELKKYKLKDQTLVNIRYGKADLKEYGYLEGTFCGAIKAVFKDDLGKNVDEKVELLKKIVNNARKQKHGTSIVITTSEIAQKEVLRLEKQSIRILEKQLKDDKELINIIEKITNIDGAIYIDINSTCYAIGVILDGMADNKHGDSSRGARFNSAIKYSLNNNKCIIVVISEDGMVNIIHKGDNYNKNYEKSINKLLSEAEKLLNDKNFTSLLEKIDEVLKLDKVNIKAYMIKGVALNSLKVSEEAIKCYNEVIEIDPNNDKAYNNKGIILASINKKEEAIECYDKGIDINPNNYKIYFNKGNGLNALDKKEEAIECYDKAIEINPNHDKVYFNKGNVLMLLGKKEEAIECYGKAIEINPNYDDSHCNKGIVLNILDKKEEAIESYDKVIEINPNHNKVYFNKGNVLRALDKKEESIECYDKAIEINPNHGDAYFNKGNVLRALDKKEESIECYDKSIEINPNNDDAYFSKGNVLMALDKKEEAIECYDKAIEINPNNDKVCCNKGVALSILDKKEEAIECYDKAIEINSNNDKVYLNKGNVLMALDKKEEAIECYDKSIEINPNNDDAYNNKGNALMALEKKEEAIECYNKAIEINPNYDKAYTNKEKAILKIDKK